MQVIYLQPDAPPKPALGAPCNGCGICCLAEPCPLGVVLSAKRTGACRALRWNEDAVRYECGAITQPKEVLADAMARWPMPDPFRLRLVRQAQVRQGLAGWVARRLPVWAMRWVAAGKGCDAALEALPAAAVPSSAQAAPPGHSAEQR